MEANWARPSTARFMLRVLLLVGIAIAAHTRSRLFLHRSVCLSVVCHILAPCLNRSMDLDAFGRYACGVQMSNGILR